MNEVNARPKRIVVTGAGGFIGHHLVTTLRCQGNYVRGVDIKYPEFGDSDANEFHIADLRYPENTSREVWFGDQPADEVYQLAADMGGIGFITSHLSDCARNNTLININMLDAAKNARVPKYLYTSSACVYAHDKQTSADVTPLKEEDAYPAMPEPGYGWEKLYAEELCKYYAHDYGMNIRIVRFHNVYGPLGTWVGGREKSPAALCRKIAAADFFQQKGIEIWGDGQQTRSYMYIDDCVAGLIRLMASDYREPLNLGTEELVSINELARLIEHIADLNWTLENRHNRTAPQGVRGRNSDNSRLRQILGWEPSIRLDEGIRLTYPWIHAQVEEAIREGAVLEYFAK